MDFSRELLGEGTWKSPQFVNFEGCKSPLEESKNGFFSRGLLGEGQGNNPNSGL